MPRSATTSTTHNTGTFYTFESSPLAKSNPPTHPSPGWAFMKLLLDTCHWVQTINYGALGRIFKHGVASSLHVERHAQSHKSAMQLATVSSSSWSVLIPVY